MKTTFKTQANANKLYIMFADLKEYSANKEGVSDWAMCHQKLLH